MSQKRAIALAERAEAYLREQQQERAQRAGGSVQTKSGLETRASKQQRIQDAKMEHIGGE